MADFEYTGNFGPEEGTLDGQESAFGNAISVVGALTSLVLVVGIAIWGYRLMIRDVSGVPVVRALEGPMRVQPKDPGGRPADYQGLAVNTIAAQGTAAPPADRLILAPRTVALADEDTPMDVNETTVAAADTSAKAGATMSDENINALVRELAKDVEPISVDMAGDEQQLTATPKPTQVVARIEHPAPLGAQPEKPAAAAVPTPEPAVLKAPGVKVSLRPVARPARAVAQVAAALTSVAAAPAADIEVDPDSLPVGTRLAQLGAYDTPDIARAAWDAVQARFADYMEGKKRVIQQASSGGRTFYRLRAMGFDDLSDARRFCTALVAENADCIPVTVR